MPKPLQDFFKQVLAEHDRGDKIRQSFDFAMAKVSKMPDNALWRRVGTRRALMWEYSVDKLIELTAKDRGLRRLDHHDTVSFIWDEAILVRLKKASMSLHTSNYPTPMADLFDNHDADLFGFIGLQRAEAVYVPNRFDTGIIWSGIVAHNENGHELWHFELAPRVVVPTATLPKPVHPPAGDLAKVKTQAKGASRKKTQDGE